MMFYIHSYKNIHAHYQIINRVDFGILKGRSSALWWKTMIRTKLSGVRSYLCGHFGQWFRQVPSPPLEQFHVFQLDDGSLDVQSFFKSAVNLLTRAALFM